MSPRASRWLALCLGLCALSASAQSVRIVLKWKEVAGASAYELEIARDSTFADVVLQTRTAAPTYRWEHLPAATHWWRVRSVDADGRPSEWSPPRTVSVDSTVPDILRPVEGAKLPCGKGLELELVPSVLVKEYQVELSTSAGFASPTVLRQSTPRFDVSALAPGLWYARAGGVDLRGRRTGPGPTRAFAVRLVAPRLTPVTDVMLGAGPVALKWGTVDCASSYLVEAVDDTKEQVTMWAVAPPLTFKPTVAGDYRWRVTGVDQAGASGEWSAEAVARVKLPAPVPRGELVGLDAELTWSPVPTAVSYRVEVTPEAGGGKRVEGTIAATQWRTAELEPGRYQWRVQAKDARGHTSGLSAPRSFDRPKVTPLPVPELRPAVSAVAIGAALEVTWGAVEGASDYEVELDGEARPPVQVTRFDMPPLAEGWHRVRVRALAAPFKESPFTALLEVFAGVPPVVGANVEVLGEAVKVGLVDRLGRLVADARPSFAAKLGLVDRVEEREGTWVMRWEAPLSGDDVLVIEAKDFHREYPLERRGTKGWLGASIGVVANGGAVLSPWGVVTGGVRLPVLDGRLGVAVRVGLYSAAASAALEGVTYRGSAWLVPASVLVCWHEAWGEWRFRGLLGPALQLALVAVNEARDARVLFGVELGASVSRRLGPGQVELELGFLYARLDAPLARLNAGGLGLRVGYVLEL